MKSFLYFLMVMWWLSACTKNESNLPIFGHTTIIDNDTIYSAIQSFSFVSQDSLIITEKTFENKIYIADFIFLSCPTICPKMTAGLKEIYETYKTNPNIYFLSHTIDPENDTIPRLKKYTEKLGIDGSKWFFVTGNKDSIYSIANESYFAAAFADKSAPGGYIHSGSFLLIDVNKHIRGVYDGTNPAESEKLINDIAILLKEQFKTKINH